MFDVFDWLWVCCDVVLVVGIVCEVILFDFGIGFGKLVVDNFVLMNVLLLFYVFG